MDPTPTTPPAPSKELIVAPRLVPAAPSQPLDVGMMLKAIIDKGVTGENVAAVEKIVDLYNKVEARQAEKAFIEAFTALQREIPAIKAKEPVPNSDGTIRYRFAPYEVIMEQLQPLLQKHGFTVDFDTHYDGNRLIKTCICTHRDGHSIRRSFGALISIPPKANATQGDGATSTYAKRYALCDTFNIVCEQDTDGDPRALGDYITPEQAKDLERRVKESGSDMPRFLKFAQAESFDKIGKARYGELDKLLRRREDTKRTK